MASTLSKQLKQLNLSSPSTSSPLASQPPSTSSRARNEPATAAAAPAAASGSGYRPPRELASVAEVLRTIKEERDVVCVYFYAQWCGTCKKADPLFKHVTKTYAKSPILFTTFDCGGEEEKLSEDTFDLTYVPCWKFWDKGELRDTVEGDWTEFQPTLRKLMGPPTDPDVPLSKEEKEEMDASWKKFVEISEGIKRRKLEAEAKKGQESGSDTDGSASDEGLEPSKGS